MQNNLKNYYYHYYYYYYYYNDTTWCSVHMNKLWLQEDLKKKSMRAKYLLTLCIFFLFPAVTCIAVCVPGIQFLTLW